MTLDDFRNWLMEKTKTLGRPADLVSDDDLRKVLTEDIYRNFAGEHDPEGVNWADLKWRDPPPPKLIGPTKALIGSISKMGFAARVARRRAKATVSMDMNELPFYGQFHQTGVRKKHLPMRAFIGASADAEAQIAQLVEDKVVELFS
jgi:hypothetical protein